MSTVPAALDARRMTPQERRASVALALLYALRMLGLFLILPVFAVHASHLPGGADPIQVGLVMGIYSLTQGVLQLPFGMLSDRLGRKPVMILGLLIFAVGSWLAAGATDMVGTIIGRAVQGMGAISATVTACLADHTRDSQRTKAMALIGASIGLTFACSLVVAPLLYHWIGIAGLFHLIGVLAVMGVAVVIWIVPGGAPVVRNAEDGPRTALRVVALDSDLLRLNLGIFVLHAVQMAMFVVLPTWLVQRAGISLAQHWQVYLPVVLLSFVLMMPPLTWAERRGRLRPVFLGAIVLLLLAQLGYVLQPSGVWALSAGLLVFFAAFNVLEASLPSMVSRLAPADAKGAALGIYNTTQALGLFVGGGVGGWLAARLGGVAVFVVCALAVLGWLAVARRAQRWPGARQPV